ncbi:amino acid transporter [Periconia macrospinosa]|uniref:Amino acid transporter n=1 Tax=Periconia macrospinosa TaxID=97972 RepID=A0A2V1DXT0_9PLEO|nr:amino acid transporter [Periconia macrospinosa]
MENTTISRSKTPESAPEKQIDISYHAKDRGNTEGSASQEELGRVDSHVTTRKNYDGLSMLALAVSLMATWEALCSTMGSGLNSGGPVALLYGFITSFIGNLLTSTSLAEGAAMYPSAGGQYQMVAELSPPSSRAIVSWYCGWITLCGWLAMTASAPYGAASLLMGLVKLNHPTFESQAWHVTVAYIGITLIALFINLYGNKIMPLLQDSIMAFHVLFFVIVFIVVLSVTPSRNSAQFVFAEFQNNTGWKSDAVAWFLGMLTSCYVMVGYDSATHLSEEIAQPAIAVPRAMVGSVVINGTMGFAMLLAVLFSMGDLGAALADRTGFPIISIFNFITRGNTAAASAMTSTVIISASLATVGLLTTTSRMMWAFARDGAPPFSKTLARLDPKSQVPIASILCSTGIIILLGILNIGSTTAFAAILSLTVVSLNLSYLMPIVLLLYRRIYTPNVFVPGPWSLKKFGVVINLVSIMYLALVSVFLLFPVSQPVTPRNMNYAIVVLGGVMVLISIYWILRARKTYKGPTLILQGVSA